MPITKDIYNGIHNTELKKIGVEGTSRCQLYCCVEEQIFFSRVSLKELF